MRLYGTKLLELLVVVGILSGCCLLGQRPLSNFLKSAIVKELQLADTDTPTPEQIFQVRELRLSSQALDGVVDLRGISLLGELEALQIHGKKVVDLRLGELRRLKKLRHLRIEHTGSQETYFTDFDNLNNLVYEGNCESRMCFSDCSSLDYLRYGSSRSGVCIVRDLQTLTELVIHAENCSVVRLLELPKLQSLIATTRASILDLGKLTQLKKLSIYSDNLSSIDLSSQQKIDFLQLCCPALQVVDLNQNSELKTLVLFNNSGKLVPPDNLNNLRYVRVAEGTLGDYRWLSKCKNLRYVELDCLDTDPDLRALVDLPTFRTPKCALRIILKTGKRFSTQNELSLQVLKTRDVSIKVEVSAPNDAALEVFNPETSAYVKRLSNRPELVREIRAQLE